MTSTGGRIRVEPSAKQVRAFVAGTAVFDTVRSLLVWEVPHYPAYYVPLVDVRADLLVPTTTTTHSRSRGDASHFTVRVGDDERIDAAWQYRDSPIEELRELLRFEWGAMDAWFEEDEEVYVHPRSPYARVDILPTSRHVRVELDGVVLADSTHARVLHETGLPPRWYLPKTDVRMELLSPTHTESWCPYKGRAEYWSVQVNGALIPDLAWSYRTPLPESERVGGLIAFYDERVDVVIDGVRQTRPKTPFS